MTKYKWLGEADKKEPVTKSFEKFDILRFDMFDKISFSFSNKKEGFLSVLNKNYKIMRCFFKQGDKSKNKKDEDIKYNNIPIYLNVENNIILINKNNISDRDLKLILFVWAIMLFFKVSLNRYLNDFVKCQESFKIKNKWLSRLCINKSFSFFKYVFYGQGYLEVKKDFCAFKSELYFNPINSNNTNEIRLFNNFKSFFQTDELYKEVEQRFENIEKKIKEIGETMILIIEFISAMNI